MLLGVAANVADWLERIDLPWDEKIRKIVNCAKLQQSHYSPKLSFR
jgi:hypothetical protein